MKIYREIESLGSIRSGFVATVGTFDGVHLGHRKVIAYLVERAENRGVPSALITFEPHPKAVVNGSTEPFVLTTVDEKAGIVEECGVEYMIAVQFDKSFASIKPKDFITQFLFEGLKVREIVVGYDHHFGFHRRGDISLLRDEGKRLGFDVDVVPPALLDGLPVSSTRIRRILVEGDIPLANRMLGRPYSLHGEVVEGVSRGGKLGFRTANILLGSERKLLPGDGVYAVMALVEDKLHQAVMNIGCVPTFKQKERSLEVHIIGFDEEIYGKEITVMLHRRIREEKKFESEKALAVQIEKDVEKSKKVLSEISRRGRGRNEQDREAVC